MCDSNFKPNGFNVTEGQAIALATGDRNVDCDLLEAEPLGGNVDRGTWYTHLSPKKPGGCELSAEVNGETGEVPNRHRSCG